MKIEDILGKVKLKHLDLLLQDQPDYAGAMSEIYGYNNNWFTRKWNFAKKFQKAYVMVQQLRNIDPNDLEITDDCPIIRPQNIDFISFQAMMELQAHLGQGMDDKLPAKMIARTIAIACYQSQYKLKKYDSEGQGFIQYENWILNQDYLQVFPVFTWIVKQLEESTETWNERFFSVEILDEDWELANGNRMSQFNVIQTLKGLCQDFNIPIEEAWQISYNMVQTNSYAQATLNHIQDQMRRVKELRMQSTRDQKNL